MPCKLKNGLQVYIIELQSIELQKSCVIYKFTVCNYKFGLWFYSVIYKFTVFTNR